MLVRRVSCVRDVPTLIDNCVVGTQRIVRPESHCLAAEHAVNILVSSLPGFAMIMSVQGLHQV